MTPLLIAIIIYAGLVCLLGLCCVVLLILQGIMEVCSYEINFN